MNSRNYMVFFLMVGICLGNAQTMSTKGAKVVVVVNTDNAIQALVLFADLETREDQLQQQYSQCNFYIGLMEGSYKIVQARVHPQSGATVNIFYNQPIFSGTEMVFMTNNSPGDLIKIGTSEARVISNNKGELILKTQ